LRRRIEVRHHLRIRHPDNDFADQRVDVVVARRVALARVQLRRHREITRLGKAAAHVADVLVYAEDLLHHQDGGYVGRACRPREVRGDLPVAGRNLDARGVEADRIGDDHRLSFPGETVLNPDRGS
jgi:hypothetical protein